MIEFLIQTSVVIKKGSKKDLFKESINHTNKVNSGVKNA